jgi:hypothetical protein
LDACESVLRRYLLKVQQNIIRVDMDAPQQASTKIRSLHAEIKSTHANQDVPSTEQLGEWRKAAASAARECIALERLIASEKHRHGVELEIMLEEMRSELVTREANAARTAERFRVLAEKNGGGSDSSAYDRAVQTAETVDAAVRALCCHTVAALPYTEMLRSDMTE